MRIVHVCRQYFPGVGGLEAVVQSLAQAQVSSGHTVRVVTLDRIFGSSRKDMSAREMRDGIEIVRIPYIGSHRYPVAPSVLKHLKSADLIHVHGIDFFYDFLALTRPIHRKPLVATTHGGFFHTRFASRLKRCWFQTITRISSRAYGAIAACSIPDEERFRKIAPQAVTLIENGVDTAKFQGLAARDLPSLLYFGRLAPNKGLDRLLNWFAEVHRRTPEWTLTIAGSPGGVTLAELHARAADLGIADAVVIISSPGDAELKSLIARSSAYACASSFEGFGLAAIEAAAAGLFPVLSRIPPFEATIDHLGAGLLLDFDDPAGAAEIFLRAWQNRRPADLAEMARRASADFGWERAARQYDDLYARQIAARRQIGHVAVDVLPRPAALERIREQLGRRAPLTVAFCNAHSVNTARNNPGFVRAMRSALVLNDGIGVDIASRLLCGRGFPDNLNGTDFTSDLLDSEPRPLRLFLLGSAPGVSEQAALAIGSRFGRHRVVGVHHGYYAPSDEEAVVQQVIEARPDLVLVGMGQPRQELWAATYAQRVPAVVMCIGAYLDFIAGVIPRAPGWIRRTRLEWAYRLLQEPRRLAGRYLLGNISFLFFVALQWIIGRTGDLPQTSSDRKAEIA